MSWIGVHRFITKGYSMSLKRSNTAHHTSQGFPHDLLMVLKSFCLMLDQQKIYLGFKHLYCLAAFSFSGKSSFLTRHSSNLEVRNVCQQA
ncbi:hypothetical protein DX877_09470 [Xylella fastidiosa subsp. fastidiosa]|nr:hypothetical protein [Xylella fastidiosa subsp. fastidiosa]QIS25372.1 hypothetical protein F7G16_03570 [Xylella fastidiosa]RUA35943.1 hypothetical protein DX877_09470 [Xylella fastidiosa subsp. fastidiosa]RUA36014.1 hypothetical protein DX878_09295 [Xylella fastidiosa subsp. fastidiosa]RWA30331.1 hypothetical protein XfCFBP8071_09525 [Xylella fastidiosa subsp. fastidiosa]